jgi:hypothetical protein
MTERESQTFSLCSACSRIGNGFQAPGAAQSTWLVTPNLSTCKLCSMNRTRLYANMEFVDSEIGMRKDELRRMFLSSPDPLEME